MGVRPGMRRVSERMGRKNGEENAVRGKFKGGGGRGHKKQEGEEEWN